MTIFVRSSRRNVQGIRAGRPHFGHVMHVYEHALRGFAVAMPATGAAALARDPRVRYVEQDSVMSIVDTQPNAIIKLTPSRKKVSLKAMT